MRRRGTRRPDVWFVACLLACGCGRPSPPTPSPPSPPVPSPRPWEIPRQEFATQRLYRVQYGGPGGGGGFRLTLRLAAPDRYQAEASDPFGRPLWSFGLEPGGALFVDHREGTYCRLEEGLAIPELDLEPLSLGVLPALLLGRLPVDGAVTARSGGEELEVVDAVGRRWTARALGGELQEWTLWAEGEPSIWWRRQERGGILSSRRGHQFRWRQTVREDLAASPEPLRPPAGFEGGRCGAASPGPPGSST